MRDKKIKALLLAAGLGTRLRPITNTVPKCLVSIGGRPLLEWWLQHLEKIGCNSTLVNTHHLAEMVQNYIKNRHKSTSNMEIREVYEENLLGTAGTLIANQAFFENSTGILIHADNATDTDLSQLIHAHQHRPSHCMLTMLTFNTSIPSCCGIVETDKNGVVQAFHEKVDHPPSNKANGAVYVFDPPFLNTLKKFGPTPTDFSTQVLPKMVGRIHTWHTNAHYLDIGTPDNLHEAQTIWPSATNPER